MTAWIIALIGIVGIIILHFYQNRKNLETIYTLKKDLYKYHINNKFYNLEASAMNGLVKKNSEERKKIIEELHENIGNKIVAAQMHYGAVLNTKVPSKELFEKAHNLLDEAVNDTRKLTYRLNKREVKEFNIISALRQVKKTLDQEGLVQLGIFTHNIEKQINSELSIRLYRMIQELITNTLTHAQANKITIQLSKIDEDLVLTVEDNGIGFKPQEVNFMSGSGIGLREIEKSLRPMNGKVFIDSTPGHGTTVTIEIPQVA